MRKNIQYNILSFITMLMTFIFLLLLGQHFGMGKQTDTYFFSIMIIAYLNYFIQATWQAMHPYYIKIKVEDSANISQLYSVLLNRIIFFSLIMIALYFLFTNTLIKLETTQQNFLNIYIFYILFQNILLFNKAILNLEKYFASYYLVDIFIYGINILMIIFFLEDDLTLIAYSMIISSTFALSWQFYLLFHKIDIKYHFQKQHQEIKTIFKNSILLKFSGLLYGSKEPLFAIIFLSFGDGLYSIFSYANKFATAIFQITTTPTINRFNTNVHYSVAQKKYHEINNKIRAVLFQTVPIFILSSIFFYFLIPYSMPFFFKKVLSTGEIKTMQLLFLYMSFFYLIIVLESPFTKTISIFKLFNYQLWVNAIFFIFICLIYLLYKTDLSFGYYSYLSIIILAQAINYYLYQQKSKTYLQGKL